MSGNSKNEVGAVLHGDNATFRVWAPFAKKVFVTGSFNNWTHSEMKSENNGYWFSVINNGDKDLFKNDPRSLQVTTSTGSSVIVDTEFDWSGDNFEPIPVDKQVIYELHIGTFNRPDASESGTFDTAMAKLDHLVDLGVNMIELMPISTM